MGIIMTVFFILVLLSCGFTKYNEDYLSKRYTNIIKGCFLVLVFFRHFLDYDVYISNSLLDIIAVKIDSILSQLIVTMFLFYSGYGIMESVKSKGKQYIENLPQKRILKTLIHFDIAVVIFIIVTVSMGIKELSVKQVILSLIAWDSYGNSNWYIFSIIILYIISYLVFRSFNDNKKRVAYIFLATLTYVVAIRYFKASYFYNTIFCFELGIIYSTYKTNIEKWLEIKKNELIAFIGSLVIFIIAFVLRSNEIFYQIHSITFAFLIVLITRKVKIKNVILEYIGRNLFPMYIFQRLPMIILSQFQYIRENTYVFFVIVFTTTILITVIYNYSLKAWEKIKESIKQVQKF